MVTIKGSYVGNRRDTAEAIDFFRRGLINAPFKTVGMSELQSVYDLMRKSCPFNQFNRSWRGGVGLINSFNRRGQDCG